MARLITDVETNGLLPQLDRIHSLVLKNVDTREVVSCADQKGYVSIKEGLVALEKSEEAWGHNLTGFDLKAIKKVYPKFITPKRVRDTLVISKMIWPGDVLKQIDFAMNKKSKLPAKLIGKYSLKAFGYRLQLYKGDYAEEMEAAGLDPWKHWSQRMQEYCEQDIDVTEALIVRAVRAGLPPDMAIECEQAVWSIIKRQEDYGVLFDEKAAQALDAKLTGRKQELETKLQEAFPPMWVSKGVVTPKRDLNNKKNKLRGSFTAGCSYTKVELQTFNPGSRMEIANRLKRKYNWKPTEFTKGGEPVVDDAVIGQLPYPEAKVLAEYLLVGKRLGQISQGKEAWLRHVKPDGRIHGRIDTLKAVTARMAHSSPNLGQVPAVRSLYGKECRALYIVPKGKKLVGIDADSLEGRCLGGYMARYDDGAFIRALLEGDKALGTDNHSVCARAIGLDPKQVYPIDGKLETGRDIAKRYFYALLYGAGDEKLGYIMGARSEKEAKKLGRSTRLGIAQRMPALAKLIEAIQKKVREHKHLIGLDGRKLFIRSEHSALNSLLQSAGALIMKYALVEFDDQLQALGLIPGQNYEFVLNVHDEWQLEVDEEYAEQVARVGEKAIATAGEILKFRCPLKGDSGIGNNWADTH